MACPRVTRHPDLFQLWTRSCGVQPTTHRASPRPSITPTPRSRQRRTHTEHTVCPRSFQDSVVTPTCQEAKTRLLTVQPRATFKKKKSDSAHEEEKNDWKDHESPCPECSHAQCLLPMAWVRSHSLILVISAAPEAGLGGHTLSVNSGSLSFSQDPVACPSWAHTV